MPMHPAFRKTFPLTALVVGAVFALLPVPDAEAQQDGDKSSEQASGRHVQRNYGVGGTSLSLSDIWGEPEMPKPSKEYPAFNYPPGGYDLNGPPSQSPYPN